MSVDLCSYNVHVHIQCPISTGTGETDYYPTTKTLEMSTLRYYM